MEEMSEHCYWLFKDNNVVHKSKNSRIKNCWLALSVCSHVMSGWLFHHAKPPCPGYFTPTPLRGLSLKGEVLHLARGSLTNGQLLWPGFRLI